MNLVSCFFCFTKQRTSDYSSKKKKKMNSEKSPVAEYPRDAHVLYQEHIRRLSEGDAVDISNLRKVEVNLQHMEGSKSAAKCVFLYEDHTLGNSLRHVLMQNPQVITAGYSVPHPLEPKMMLQISANGYAPDVVAEGLEELATICEGLASAFNATASEMMNGNGGKGGKKNKNVDASP
jgi:DNA-directed RNA polymerase I and III subunit RPAC2